MFLTNIKNEYLNILTAKNKFLVITIMMLTIIFVFSIALKKVCTSDPMPTFTAINTKIIKELGTFAVKVKTGLFIKNFPEFDVIKNSFVIDAVLWFEFNSDEIMLETVEKFSFDRGNIVFKTPSDIKIRGNRIFAKYNIIFNMKCDLHYKKFPFEDHKIIITISNNFVTPQEMYFKVDGTSFQIAPNVFPTNWKLYDLNVDAGYQKLIFDTHDTSKKTENPKGFFIITIVKSSIRKTLLIFIPIFFAILLAFFSFVMSKSNTGGKFSLAISSVTALLGYRFVIEQMMPQVGYFTTTDVIYLLLLVAAFVIFIYQLLYTRFLRIRAEKKQNDKKNKIDPLEVYNSYVFLVIVVLFTISTSYIILK